MIRLAMVFALGICASGVQGACRQALALGLDVSGSVDAQEYRLQLDGLATALGDPDVIAALLDGSGAPVRLAIYEWSAPEQERILLDWTDLHNRDAVLAVQTTLRQTRRAPMGPSTGLGHAMRVGLALLDQQSACWQQTLDISGDGIGNVGLRPQDIRDVPAHITINGLVIGVDDFNTAAVRDLQIGELSAYYTAYVIRGPDAFVEAALGFDDYAAAMRRKLLRELATLAIGDAGPPPQTLP